MIQWLRNKIKYSIFLLLILLCFLASSCENSTRRTDTVVIGIRADFDSLNELNAADTDALQVIHYMLFMSLTRLDRDLNVVPHLARKWKFEKNDTVLTYYLRDDVYWTDGEQTTADDVVFTYEVATDPNIAYPAVSRFDFVERVEKVDDFTVRFHLSKAYPDIFFDTQIPILPKHILGAMTPDELLTSYFNRSPIGNGPFKLVAWQANRSITFAANVDYALGRPELDRVIFSIVPDETVLLTNLQTGAVDLVLRLTPDNLKQIETNEILVRSFTGNNFTFIGWNNERPRLAKAVRQAMTYGINKNEIVNTLLQGYGKPAVGPLTPLAWAFDKNLNDMSYNPARARQILAQQGWRDPDKDGILDKNGTPLTVTIKVNIGSQLRQDVAVMVQAQLKEIGVNVKVQRVEWNLFIQHVFQEGDFDAVVLAWDTDFTVNPTALWHSSAIENGYNFVSYRNPKVDNLLELGRDAKDQVSAQPLWSEFQQTVIEDCPYTFLFIQDNIVAHNKRLKNCEFDIRSHFVNIAEWHIQ